MIASSNEKKPCWFCNLGADQMCLKPEQKEYVLLKGYSCSGSPLPRFHIIGSLLRWIDEEAAIYSIIQLGTNRCVTKYMSEINFINSARQGDIVELGIKATHFGRTSLTLTCQVRNKITHKTILTIDKMVFVSVNEQGVPFPHGKTEITYTDERLRED